MIRTITNSDINEMSGEARSAIDYEFNGFDFEVSGWIFYPGQTIESLKKEWAYALKEEEEEGRPEDWKHYTEIPGHGVIWTL